jgi:oligopeptide/dipeptide ABC transporter ATP-binding protein
LAIGCVSNSIPSSASYEPTRQGSPVKTGPLLEIENLSTHYVSSRGTRVVRAVDQVSLRINAGETLGIVGESGSGKSTLALTILRVLPAAARIVEGRMLFEGEDLVQKSDEEMRHIRGKRIAMILQDPMASLNPLFTIGDQVAEPMRVHEGTPRATAWNRARELLKSVRIPSPETRVTQYPHEMSGGMRQRIVGAIGIACEPRLLIADEPTTSLDLTIQAQYLNLLRELQRTHGLALIFITHNLGIVAKMCDQLAVMYAGRVVESGPVSRVFNTPAHPYTEALLNSIPRMSDSGQRLAAIEGQPPDLAALPAGCAFAPRCVKAFDRCRVEAPPELALGERRTARCWLATSDPAVDAVTSGSHPSPLPSTRACGEREPA